MRQFIVASIMVVGLLGATSAVAQTPSTDVVEPVAQPGTAPVEPGKPGADKDDPERLVCRREHEMGSNRPKKVCRTAAEWKRQREEAARATRGGMGGVRPSGGLGATPAPGAG